MDRIHYFADNEFCAEGVISNGMVALKKLSDIKDEPLHDHDFVEIVYIHDGKGAHYVNGVEYLVQKGDLLYINYGCTHSFKVYEKLVASNDIKFIAFDLNALACVAEQLVDNGAEIADACLHLCLLFRRGVNHRHAVIHHGRTGLHVVDVIVQILRKSSCRFSLVSHRNIVNGWQINYILCILLAFSQSLIQIIQKGCLSASIDAHDNIDIRMCRKLYFLMIPDVYIYIFNMYLCHNCTL